MLRIGHRPMVKVDSAGRGWTRQDRAYLISDALCELGAGCLTWDARKIDPFKVLHHLRVIRDNSAGTKVYYGPYFSWREVLAMVKDRDAGNYYPDASERLFDSGCAIANALAFIGYKGGK